MANEKPKIVLIFVVEYNQRIACVNVREEEILKGVTASAFSGLARTTTHPFQVVFPPSLGQVLQYFGKQRTTYK